MAKTSISLILLFSFLTGILYAQPDFDSLTLKWEYYKLPNGINVILQPDTTQKEIAVEFWIHAGTRNEIPGQYGFAHFFEHATPYGFVKDSLLRNAFRTVRTNSNAQTRNDYTRYYVQVKPEGLQLALKYSAERLDADLSLVFDSTIEKHRKNVLNEMARQESNPLYSPTANAVRREVTFGADHPYGHGSYGTIGENERFTTADVKEWYTQYFLTTNTILLVSGNFDILDIKPRIEREFGTIMHRGSRMRTIIPQPHPVFRQYTIPGSAAFHFLSITWPAAAFGSDDDPGLSLLALILEDRLSKDQPQYIKQSGSSDLFALYELAGQFGVFASFNTLRDSMAVENHLRSAIKNIIQKNISKQELDSAKARATAHTRELLKNLGFIDSRNELLGEGFLFANNPGYYLERIRKLQKLNSYDLQLQAAKWLSGKGARVLIISDKIK
jgi:zinc protease